MKKTKNSIETLESQIKKIEKEIFDKNDRLKINPFPPAAIAKDPKMPPLDEITNELIKKYIMSTYLKRNDESFGEYAGLTIIGDYGMGKTHTMKHIEYIINSLNNSDVIEYSALTVYIDRPDESPQKVIHKIIELIEFDSLRKYIWNIIITSLKKVKIEDFKKEYISGMYKYIENNDWKELFDEPIRSNPLEFLNKFNELGGDLKKLQENSRDIIKKEIVPDEVLVDRYLYLIFPDKKVILNWEALAGYINSRDLEKKEVQFLKSIVKILKKNNYDMLYVFIDEFEDVSKLKGIQLTNYLLTLNTLINSESNWAVIVSLTSDALKRIKEESVPLYDRLTTYSIELERLDEKKAKELIKNYLVQAIDKDDYFPFTEDLIKKILFISKGNYRSFIRIAHRLVEEQRMSYPTEYIKEENLPKNLE